MSNVIDTESTLFKMYAARRVRKGPCWDVEDVLEIDAKTINICSYFREIFLEGGYHTMVALAKLFSGLLLIFMILTPLLSAVACLLTDNGWIIVFGVFGEVMLVLDAIVLFFVSAFVGIITATIIVDKVGQTSTKLSNSSATVLWIKNKHGKFCTKLSFDRKSKIDQDTDEEGSHE